MRFGFTLPNNMGVADPDEVAEIAVDCERLGFDSVWVAHHVLNIGYVRERLGERPYHDALTILTWAAAKTSRVELGTSVLVLPYLHPATLAKQLATLDHLSRGRLVVGVGVGSLPEENAALGVPYEERGPLTDEFLSVMAALWAPGPATVDGEHLALRRRRSPPPSPTAGPTRRSWWAGTGRRPCAGPPAGRAGTRCACRPSPWPSAWRSIDAELAAAGRSRADGFRVHACLDLDLWEPPGAPAPRRRCTAPRSSSSTRSAGTGGRA